MSLAADKVQKRQLRQYFMITGNYWAFTLTDGALRMMVVLHFHSLGYSPLAIAMLFLFYEFFGVVTNLVGGWIGARAGLNTTMNLGLGLQVAALFALTIHPDWLTISWVMAAQALSGIAKDLNKMSAKSSVKYIVKAADQQQQENKLFKWVAALTGSKNALKGVGFFLGGFLLTTLGFKGAALAMALALIQVWVFSAAMLTEDLGKAKYKPKFRDMLSKSRAINVLSSARMFLFGARDVWFVVALPVFLTAEFGWTFWQTGGFLAFWIIGYGVVQGFAPKLVARNDQVPHPASATFFWASILTLIPIAIALTVNFNAWILLVGLLVFGVIFAINSSLHSYLIVSYANADGVSLDVGFYYMANALGRLIGTVLSGWVFQTYGLVACLWVSAGFVALAALISLALPKQSAVDH